MPYQAVGGNNHAQRELSSSDYHHPPSKESSSDSGSYLKQSSDSYFLSSDKAAMEFNPSSDSYYYSSKIKGKGFNPFSAMGWLTDGCPGERTSEDKERLYKVCARAALFVCGIVRSAAARTLHTYIDPVMLYFFCLE